MIVKQLSAFIENKAGRLAELAETLAANDVDVSALSLADSADYGVARMIVSDPEKAAKVLDEHWLPRHSEQYRAAYHPAYRVLYKDFKKFKRDDD